MSGGRKHYVGANLNLVPDRWWQDPLFAREIREKILRMYRHGYSQQDIARHTGVSDRSVLRIIVRNRPEPVGPPPEGGWRCGARTTQHRPTACLTQVPGPDIRCRVHTGEPAYRPRAEEVGPFLCGAERTRGRYQGKPCTSKVPRRGERCFYHR